MNELGLKTWTPAVQRKTPDNLVSSRYTMTRVFRPSYEKEGEPRIEQLLSHDYQRIWWKEKIAWDKTISAKKIASKKILPRKLVKRKVPTCVTVKYATREKKGEESKTKPRENLKTEAATFAKHSDVKSEKRQETKPDCEETKSERRENRGETRSERSEEGRSEKIVEVKWEGREETKSEKYEEAKTRECEGDAKSEEREETRSEKWYTEAKSQEKITVEAKSDGCEETRD